MFETYLVCEEGFKNVVDKGAVTGFQVKARIANWRGMPLSLINDVSISVDGTMFPRDQIRVSVGGGTFTLDEMTQRADVRWQFDELATITVLHPGGLAPGLHDVTVSETIRTGLNVLPGNLAVQPNASVGKRKMTLVA